MKVSYEYYVDTFKGKICQPEFEDLVEPVIDLVKGYAEQFIAPWALEKISIITVWSSNEQYAIKSIIFKQMVV